MDKERDHVFHQFMRTSRGIAHKTHSRLETLGLYRGQPPLLFALWEKDERSRKELSQTLRIQPATVTKMVKRLSMNGFLTSKTDLEDSRISRVCLTEKGKAIETEVKAIHDDLKETVFTGFSDKELEQLGQYLARIRENLGPKECKGSSKKGEEKNHG